MGKASCSRCHIENSSGLQNPIQTQASFMGPIAPFTKVQDPTFLPNGDRYKYVDKVKCLRDCAHVSQFRISHVLNTQRRWNHEANFQPPLTQQIPDPIQIPINQCAKNTRFLTTIRLPSKNRSISCIFPHTCGTGSQEILKSNFQPKSVTNDVPAIWPRNCTSCFCNVEQLDRADSKGQRDKDRNVFRRLPVGQSEQGSTDSPNPTYSKAATRSRLATKLQKIYPCPTEINRISGYLLGPMGGSKMASTKKVPFHRGQSPTNIEETNGSLTRNSKSDRAHKLCELSCNSGSIKSQATALLLPRANKNQFLSTIQSPQCGNSRIRMVDKELQCSFPATPSTGESFLDYRCVRNSLGSPSRQPRAMRSLVSRGNEIAFQYKRNARCAVRNKRATSLPSRFLDYASERQQDCGVLSEEGRRDQITKPYEIDTRSILCPRRSPHKPGCSLPARQIEQRSRSLITVPTASRMASSLRNDQNNLQKMGHSPNRPDGIQDGACCLTLRELGPNRCGCRVSRRFQPPMGVHPRMGVSATFPCPESANSPEHSQGNIPDCGSDVGESVLETRHQESISSPSVYNTSSAPSISGHIDGPASTENSRDEPTDLEMWGWTPRLKDWTPEQKQILKSGWRDSSLKTYNHAWRKWLKWCSENNINTPYKPEGSQLARFLIDLYQKQNLAYSTILVYKSAISTMCNPDFSERLSSHILVKKALTSISNQRPKPIAKAPIWDVDELTKWLLKNNPDRDNLYQCSKRSAILLLLCSGRRVHDLTLLAVDEDHCTILEDTIVFWPKFGSKTDKSDVRQSGWRLTCNADQPAIDPVYWVKRVIELSASRRSQCKSDHLFITACGAPKPASRAVIAGWVKRLLEEAGIQASPGSTRSAVASKSWVSNCPLDDILARGNWRSQDTFKRYYCREIKPSQHQTNVVSAMFHPIAN